MLEICFFFINVFIFFFGMLYFKKVFNPISIYSFVFGFSSFLYSLRLVYYDDIDLLTFVVLLIFEFMFCFGALIGSNKRSTPISRECNEKKEKKIIGLTIIICSILASIAIVTGFLSLLRDYSYSLTSILANLNKIYNERIMKVKMYVSIPYLSSFSYFAIILSGIYLKKYGFKIFIIIPFILLIMEMMMTGNRYYLILSFLEFIICFVLTKKRKQYLRCVNRPNRVFKMICFIGFVAIALSIFLIFNLITKERSAWIETDSSYSPMMVSLVNRFGQSVYKVYTYFASPIPVLNAFLKDPYYSFGTKTFAPFFNIFQKFGFFQGTVIRSKDYFVPVNSNTGTFALSLFSDFYVFSFLFSGFFGYLCAYLYVRALSNQSILSICLSSIFLTVLFLSFFTWYFVDSGLWICIFLSIIFCHFLKRSTVVSYGKSLSYV